MRIFLSLASLLLISVPAQAGAIFSFSFQNVGGNVPGTVSGTITLSGTGDGTFAATSIIVDAAPATLGYTYPFDVLSNMPTVFSNSFVVSNGQIDKGASEFGSASVGFNSYFTLNYLSAGSIFSNPAGISVEDFTSTTLSYNSSPTPAAVPEPSTSFALVAVCGVIYGLRRLRRSA